MPLTIEEWFGYHPGDNSDEVRQLRVTETCPILKSRCLKTFHDGTVSGVCCVGNATEGVVCTCPIRMYTKNDWLLHDVACTAFGPDVRLLPHESFAAAKFDGLDVLPFGKRYMREIRLPGRGGTQSFFVDWILARIGADGRLAEFVALEIQTIDTTGTYKPAVELLRAGANDVPISKAGLNWENVHKRILPQLIYKGHVLRRERLCPKGLFFACPSQVYRRIHKRLGGSLQEQFPSQGSITFQWYDVEPHLGLSRSGSFTTTVDQVALAFTSPSDLPESGVYQVAIEKAIEELRG